MSQQVKKAKGELFELDNKDMFAEGDVSIVLQQDSSNTHPTLDVMITIAGNQPQLHYKECILRLNSNMAGQVRLLLPTIKDLQRHSFNQTTFQVIPESPNWTSSLDWFHALPAK